MDKHTIATYNMSFAGDAGLDPKRSGVFESEGAFHLSNPNEDKRQFWINALEVVVDFWSNLSDPSVMGLQEINKTESGTTGSAKIESSVRAAVASRDDAFEVGFVTEEIIVNPNVKPAVMLIWNETKLGNKKRSAISDLDYTPGDEAILTMTKPNGSQVKKSGKQTGRPILMVLTEGGYLLINCHAPNHPELSEKKLADFRDALEKKVVAFLGSDKVNPDKVFLMGDFNDRYDALQSVSLSVGNLMYQGKAPLSCCHNWDSSCTDTRYRALDIDGREKVGTCDPEGKPLAGPGPRTLMGEEGNIENYRYYGDKVFGATPLEGEGGNIQIYPPGRRGASQQSDHEMVIATFTSPTQGGRRSNKKKRKTRVKVQKRKTRVKLQKRKTRRI
jgi:hypothetical protein